MHTTIIFRLSASDILDSLSQIINSSNGNGNPGDAGNPGNTGNPGDAGNAGNPGDAGNTGNAGINSHVRINVTTSTGTVPSYVTIILV